MRNKRGITLVALVITIIILLILAGITIIQLTNSGLFEKSQIAKEKYVESKNKENETLSDYEENINEYLSSSRLNSNNSNNKFKKLLDSEIAFSADVNWSSVDKEVILNDKITNYDFIIIVGDQDKKTSSGTYLYTINDIVYNDSENLKEDGSQLIMTIARQASQTAIEMWFKNENTLYISRAVHVNSKIDNIRIKNIYGVKL